MPTCRMVSPFSVWPNPTESRGSGNAFSAAAPARPPGSSLAAQRPQQRDECPSVAERDRKVVRLLEFSHLDANESCTSLYSKMYNAFVQVLSSRRSGMPKWKSH
jgi:hypothetical protein